jgi:hypothetical protein
MIMGLLAAFHWQQLRPRAWQLGSQGAELLKHLLILVTQHPYLFPLRPYLLLLSQDERPGISRQPQPVGF